jgi:uncharacterized membrane-anchored protein
VFLSELTGIVLVTALFGGGFVALFFAARARRRAVRKVLGTVALVALVFQAGCAALLQELNRQTSGSNDKTFMWWVIAACAVGAVWSFVLICTRGKAEQTRPPP